ncbi:cob(I)yrinic acid a,c-diamide adenosyltransferase [Kistimonas asteriae]|uniref:cob(I)yrinic acid a,c-diamide adenosyltransferase n=1 Tax=Kistimonas asteriae TaxID=517724 RepID=UPI001BAD4B46|nr:cob(I)yrinic acid a,c-diamide adenosyltransferase [Kistimonas asteriae]
MSENERNRLTKIYTRTGDKGSTSLGGGTRVPKTHARIEAIGSVDELNAWMGMLICELKDCQILRHKLQKPLEFIQHRLFDVGGELAMPGYQLVRQEFVTYLEEVLDEFNEGLPPLKNFILPGGSRLACHCHMVRTVSRRAERRVIAAKEAGEEINAPLMQFLNRLSDLMFVLGRVTARQSGGEVLWQQSEKTKVE